VADLSLPTYLVRVKLCGGKEVYLLNSELDNLLGEFITLHYIRITSLDQTFDVGLELGDHNDRYDLFAMGLMVLIMMI